ncbi:B-cell lymphoma 6 protein-like [Gracilariopsis chorda]|uniref:B-cell lymphoma 6 protein-like n=1 Tax=Gracilariopsis chorda TaxID=448386 RepID=A0A2V3IJM9_9FLOR|nr:B-cell lymphoma 6 protein-like [Gracilariopsis chorda]|eukprot:PXF42271.1 B-cell lymphoma 6 protein-like [Gracilariopsis chorda]
MDLDPILNRYLANNDVSCWLFERKDIRTVTAESLQNAVVYAIGFHNLPSNVRRELDIEDILLVCGVSGTFVLGLLYGLATPHIFAKSPFMAGKRPLTRRFAVDLSQHDALEFLEIDSFEDGKTAVVYRRFLYTNDNSLPCVVAATLHLPCSIPYTLGTTIMRVDVLEAPACPNCGQCGKRCKCSFDSYAPTGAITHTCYSWNQFSAMFLQKARFAMIKYCITARVPNVGDVCISNTEIPVVNVIERGHKEYMNLLRRKAVEGLGLNVVMARNDSPLISSSTSNDFLDMHNQYIVRKRRERELDLIEDNYQGLISDPSSSSDPSSLTAMTNNVLDITHRHHPIPPVHTEGDADADILELITVLAKDEPGSNFVLESQQIDNSGEFDCASPFGAPPFTLTTTQSTHGPQEFDAGASSNSDILRDLESLVQTRMSISLSKSTAGTMAASTSAWQPSPNANPHSFSPINITVSSKSSAGSYQPAKKRRPSATSNTTGRNSVPSSASSGSADSETSGKRHSCSHCNARFKMRGDLLRHIRTVHEGKKRYQCTYCSKAFGHSGHLNRHVQSVHLQLRRFKCEICGFQFFQASHLQSHMGHVHNPKKPYACNVCGVRVNSQTALRSHRSKTKCSEIDAGVGARAQDQTGTGFLNSDEEWPQVVPQTNIST